jgi:hypothetical protein
MVACLLFSCLHPHNGIRPTRDVKVSCSTIGQSMLVMPALVAFCLFHEITLS